MQPLSAPVGQHPCIFSNWLPQTHTSIRYENIFTKSPLTWSHEYCWKLLIKNFLLVAYLHSCREQLLVRNGENSSARGGWVGWTPLLFMSNECKSVYIGKLFHNPGWTTSRAKCAVASGVRFVVAVVNKEGSSTQNFKLTKIIHWYI